MASQPIQAQQLIDGQWVDGAGSNFQRHTPAEDAVVCAGRQADAGQVAAAIAASRAAFAKWSETSIDHRMGIAKHFAELVTSQKEELAQLISTEVGKPLWESRTEAAAVAGKVANSIDAILKRRWTTTEPSGAYVAVTRYRPHGVMLVLGPFNLPAHLPGAHIVPALLAGNTVVFKPSELAPAVGQWLVRTWQAAGLPQGVLNLIQGGPQVAASAVANDDVAGVLFTGSHRVGVLLHQAMAGKPHKVLALEMGGNNPLVIHRCSDIRRAAITVLHSAYITSGQRCTCARRLIVVGADNYHRMLHTLSEMLPKVRVGQAFDQLQPFMGSLIHSQAAQQMLAAQNKLFNDGAEAIIPMQRIGNHPALLGPGLIKVDQAKTDDCEHFGPLLLARAADDLDHAIELANDTKFGLSAGFLSDSVDDFHYFLHRIHAGVVNWNRQTTGASGRLPFGGVGASGNHWPSGFFAADYCSFPIASLESHELNEADQPLPGLEQV